MGEPLPLFMALLAVLLLIGLTRVLGFVGKPTLASCREAEDLSQSLPGGFRTVETELAIDGSGALLRDGGGRIAVVAAMGAHFLVRLQEGDWTVREAPDGELTIIGSDFSCRLTLGRSAPQWRTAIQAAGHKPA